VDLGHARIGKSDPALGVYVAACKQRPSVQTSGWLDTFAEFVRGRDPERVLAA
jgi:hypothetical protein